MTVYLEFAGAEVLASVSPGGDARTSYSAVKYSANSLLLASNVSIRFNQARRR
jgi:hypothetical protein